MALLLICMGHLSLCLGRVEEMRVFFTYLLKVRETQCVLMGHSLAPLMMMWEGCRAWIGWLLMDIVILKEI